MNPACTQNHSTSMTTSTATESEPHFIILPNRLKVASCSVMSWSPCV